MLEIFVKCTNYEVSLYINFSPSYSFCHHGDAGSNSSVVHVGKAKGEMAIRHRIFLLLSVVISPHHQTNLSSRLGTTAQFVAAVLSHSTTTTNYYLPYVEVSSVFCISSFYIPSLDSANKVQINVKPNSYWQNTRHLNPVFSASPTYRSCRLSVFGKVLRVPQFCNK